jgi:hypothetical protein
LVHGDSTSIVTVRDVGPAGRFDAVYPTSPQGYAGLVTDAAETLLEQALTLPVEDRALLASGLLASLDSEDLDESDVERLWTVETERRSAQLESGVAGVVTWEHLHERIADRRS